MTQVDTADAVQVERASPACAVLRLNRAARRNAMDVPSMALLARTLESLLKEPELRVLILTGAGTGFCAGLDLVSLVKDGHYVGLDVAQAWRLQLTFEGVVRQLRASEVIVIAAVNGVAVGAGMGLALAADIRLAGASAAFHVGAVKVGLSGGECGISYHLPRLVGAARAFELMLTGRPVMADEALRIGLVADVVPDEHLMERALDCARQVLATSPYSAAHTKRVMWANLDAGGLDAALELENHTQVLGLMGQDFAQAVEAFAARRAQ